MATLITRRFVQVRPHGPKQCAPLLVRVVCIDSGQDEVLELPEAINL